ncbi:hypothetical protein [Actinomadura sp. 6N118]|uniref:hypothetical protein n=1 Tax=Actinomadura sp. 6N118 TaxID=3375151 RepID=UPI0037A49F3C
MTPFTINVSGSERYDGEKPYTVVVDADSMTQAKRAAWLWFVWNIVSECGQVAADGTILERPDLDLLAAAHNDDVVVIDCPEFRCHTGEPFTCDDPYHYEKDVTGQSQNCHCTFNWYWAHDQEPMDLNRLTELGYRIPEAAPYEEDRW